MFSISETNTFGYLFLRQKGRLAVLSLAIVLITLVVEFVVREKDSSINIKSRIGELKSLSYEFPFNITTIDHYEQQTASLPQRLGKNEAWYERIWYKIMDEGNREPSAWRYLYVDELKGSFKLRVADRTVDERYANMNYEAILSGQLDFNYFKFNSGDPEEDRLNELRVAGKQVDESQCARDLAEMAAQMDEMASRLQQLRNSMGAGRLESRHLKLARVLDSYGRYESASLTGHHRLIGGYNQCIHSNIESRHGDIDMHYCWARMQLDRHLSVRLKTRARFPHEKAEIELQVGTCLPRSCHTKTLHKHKHLVQRFIDSQLVLPPSIYVNQSLELESVFCLVDDDSEFGMPLSGKLCVAFLLLWTAVCLLVTYFRRGSLIKAKEAGEKQMTAASGFQRSLSQTLACLDLGESWSDLVGKQRLGGQSPRVNLDVLNPIKFGILFLVTITHSAWLLELLTARRLATAASLERGFSMYAMFINVTYIDTLFVITGVLFTYTTLKKLSRRVPQQQEPPVTNLGLIWRRLGDMRQFLRRWLVLTANRTFRLVPLYVLMVWFRRDVLIFLGSGPLWDFGFNRETMNGACSRDSSLLPLSFLASFAPFSKQCFLPAWSISLDMQFGLAIAPIILTLPHRPRLSLTVLVALTLGCTVCSLRDFLELPAAVRWELVEFRSHGLFAYFNPLSSIYTSPLNRAPSLLIGTIAGYALFLYDKNAASRWPGWLAGTASRYSLVYLVVRTVVSFFMVPITALIFPHHRLASAFFATLDRPVWAVVNATLLMRALTDWSCRLSSFTKAGWAILARLCYSLLFTHWLVILIQNGLLMALPTYSYWQMWATMTAVYCMALPNAALVHVLFENPIDKLIKRAIPGL